MLTDCPDNPCETTLDLESWEGRRRHAHIDGKHTLVLTLTPHPSESGWLEIWGEVIEIIIGPWTDMPIGEITAAYEAMRTALEGD